MEKLRASLLIMFGWIASVDCATAQAPRDLMPWANDFRQAAEIASRERKLVLLHFASDDCPPCRAVEQNVFTQQEVANSVYAGFVPVKVNVESTPELARRYQVTRWPTDVIVNPAGQELFRTVTPQDPRKYTYMLTEVARQSGSQLAARNPDSNSLAMNADHLNPMSGGKRSTYSEPASAPTSSQNQVPSAGGQYITNSLVSQTQQPPRDHSYAGDYQPAGDPNVATNSVPNAPLPPPPDFSRQNPVELKPSAAPAINVAGNTTSPSVNPGSNLPPLGMEGYCVITLDESKVWKRGDKRFGAIHRGKLYLFAGEVEQQKFLAEPDRYSPALSGFDPVQFSETGRLVDGKRSYGFTYKKIVYLFSDETSLSKFKTQPNLYADTVHQAMLRADNATKFR